MFKKKSSLALFFMRGTSLIMWKKIGIFDREVVVYNALAKYFDKLYLVTYGNDALQVYKKYLRNNIEIIPNRWKINASLYSFIAPILIANKLRHCDYYRTDQMDGVWMAAVAKLLFHKKLIVRTGYTWSKSIAKDNGIVKTLVWIIERFVYKFCDFATVTSNSDREYLEEKFPFVKNKIATIPNYINTDLFKPRASKKYDDRIIFVGRLAPEKNLINLIRALQGVPCSLDLVGEGCEKNKIIEIAEKSHVEVKFLGIIQNNNLPIVLNKYHIFVLPSLFEGMPKSLLEAMSCGLACVGTRVAGIKEVISDHVNGMLADIDEKSLRKIIIRIIDDRKLQGKLGEAARKLILEKYSLKNNINKEIKIYDSFEK